MNEVDPVALAKELEVEADEYFVNLVSVDVDEYAKSHFNKSVKRH